MRYSSVKRELLEIELSETMRAVSRQMDAFLHFCADRDVPMVVSAYNPDGDTQHNKQKKDSACDPDGDALLVGAASGDDRALQRCTKKNNEMSLDTDREVPE